MYNVYVESKLGELLSHREVKTKKQAITHAKNVAAAVCNSVTAQKDGHGVFISYLSADGQTYFINPDGDISITGKSWGESHGKSI